MTAVRVFISFDYDHDLDLRNLLAGQAKHPGSPFEIADWSVKKVSANWEADARRRIRAVGQVAVICGEHTHTAAGVAKEVKIAQEVGTPYFLLHGRKGKACRKPSTATTDTVYEWTWENLKNLIKGAR